MEKHRVVSNKEWLEAGKDFLEKEKLFTRMRDQVTRERRELPWEAVSKDYVFEGADGKKTPADLFERFGAVGSF
jgi:predicted dithiol-disulfide oxidoreductase (DUF899 family)